MKVVHTLATYTPISKSHAVHLYAHIMLATLTCPPGGWCGTWGRMVTRKELDASHS